MAEIAKKNKSRKKLILAIIIIAAVAAAGIIFYFRIQAAIGQGGEDMPDVVMLSKTDLESKVTASGNFASGNPVSVGSNVTGGEVEAVYIEVGDKVYAGDILAKLKTSDIERNISDTKTSLSETYQSDRLSKEQAQRALDQAYDDYYTTKSNQDRLVKRAEEDLKTAKDRERPAAQATAAAEWLAMTPAEQAATGLSQTDWEAKRTDELLDAATVQESRAVTNAKSTRSQQMTQAERAIQSAQDRLDSLNVGDNTKQQRSQLESLEENLENASIISPITGIVTSVTTEAGKAVMGDMFTIENTESLEISATVAEYDVIKIENGMKANITSNATDEQKYTGVVTYVAPKAADSSGNFAVTVQVTSDIGQLKPGMTATIEIVTAMAADVFAVPIDAVVTRADGKKVVYAYEIGGGMMLFSSPGDGEDMPERVEGSGPPEGFTPGEGGPVVNGNGQGPGVNSSGPQTFGGNMMTEGTRREIVVETGLETDYYIEIISDELYEGMLILSDPMGRGVGNGNNPPGAMGGGPMGGGVMVSGESSNRRGGGDDVVVYEAGP